MFGKFFGEVKNLELREKLLLALIFVLPFERIPSVELGGLTIKLSLLIGLALVAVSLTKTSHSFKGMNHFARLPRVFLEFSLLSALWVVNLNYWFKANLIIGFCILLYFTVMAILKSSNSRDRLIGLALKTVLISAGVVMSLGFLQWLGNLIGISDSLTAIRPEYTADKLGLPRMHSTLLEPLYFGLYLLLPLGILWADRAGVIIKNLYFRLTFIALIYLSILLSLARGAIVASAAIGLIGLAYSFNTLKSQLNLRATAKLALGGLIGLSLLVGATSLLGKQGTDQDHLYGKGFSTIAGHLETIRPWGSSKDETDQNSINSRDVAREEAWGVITASPKNFIIGVGAGQYGLSLEPEQGFEATSNFMLLDVLAKYGLLGLAILLVYLIWIIYMAFKKTKQSLSPAERVLTSGFGIYLVGLLIQSVTFGELAITHIWVALALLVAVITNAQGRENGVKN